MIRLTIPWPPSANTYWRHVGGKVLISEPGRQYRIAVRARILSMRSLANVERKSWPLPLASTSRLRVQITAHMPDRRRRDLDNLLKASLDAMTHAGVWGDDSQIDDLRVCRHFSHQPHDGHLLIEIQETT